jgi:hypothetical protein
MNDYDVDPERLYIIDSSAFHFSKFGFQSSSEDLSRGFNDFYRKAKDTIDSFSEFSEGKDIGFINEVILEESKLLEIADDRLKKLKKNAKKIRKMEDKKTVRVGGVRKGLRGNVSHKGNINAANSAKVSALKSLVGKLREFNGKLEDFRIEPIFTNERGDETYESALRLARDYFARVEEGREKTYGGELGTDSKLIAMAVASSLDRPTTLIGRDINLLKGVNNIGKSVLRGNGIVKYSLDTISLLDRSFEKVIKREPFNVVKNKEEDALSKRVYS